MAEIVNLRTVRKRKARTEREDLAAENRAKFGKTKAAREQDSASKALETRRLDGHKREGDQRQD